MPFDDSKAVSEVDADRRAIALVSSDHVPQYANQAARDVSLVRHARIQRTVEIIAAIFFGALGALGGAALVILMLVALVIPATTSLVLAAIAVAIMAVVLVMWLRRNSAVSADDATSASAQFSQGVTV